MQPDVIPADAHMELLRVSANHLTQAVHSNGHQLRDLSAPVGGATASNPCPTSDTTLTIAESRNVHSRKPSPGLTARIHALGRSASLRLSSGRGGHRDDCKRTDEWAFSTGAIDQRREPTWRRVLTSKQSQSSLRTSTTSPRERSAASDAPTEASRSASEILRTNQFLPEIEPTAPRVMDANKFRTPLHTNGNGETLTAETRAQHLERDTISPAALESPGPPPPAKDTPPAPPIDEGTDDFNSYFSQLGLQRPGSIYTISRASFANQLAQLTSLQLPDAESLASKVAAIPTAQAATKALFGAAEQIRSWINKAAEVIEGLDSEDDVEWAAAGGREGLEDVETAIHRFEDLIKVYVGAIEELQGRSDIANVPPEDLKKAVAQMEAIMKEWTKIRNTLSSVRAQVEIAMEWEELWNVVLGEIQDEMEELSKLVFEMEEQRHKGANSLTDANGLDFGDLVSITEDSPSPATSQRAMRLDAPKTPTSPGSPGGPSLNADDSTLLSLFARMQPLRASLDFLPMRLSVFETRASEAFPTACEELDMRRENLDGVYRKLEKDSEILRKELGEDRWVLVFRGAAQQAVQMYDSVERSVAKLKEGIDSGMHLTNQPGLTKRIEGYEAKKTHYGPAIDRVLAIIDKGVKDRLTVNGEILRLHTEMQKKWDDLKTQFAEVDTALEELNAGKKFTQFRDSVSTLLSVDRSSTLSGPETPGSSPPSSIFMAGLGISPARTPKTMTPAKVRRTPSSASSYIPRPVSTRRSVSAASSAFQNSPTSRLSTLGVGDSLREGSVTPIAQRSAVGGLGANLASATRTPARPTSSMAARPVSSMATRTRWGGFVDAATDEADRRSRPLSGMTPRPFARDTPPAYRSQSTFAPSASPSRMPQRSFARAISATTSSSYMAPTQASMSRSFNYRDRADSGSSSNSSRPPLTAQNSRISELEKRRSAIARPPSATLVRPMSSLASSRRSSMLPQPTSTPSLSASGRDGPQAVAGAKAAFSRTQSASTMNLRAAAQSREPPRLRR